MIILVTGQPGSGKTAHVVDMLANDAQFQNRTLICGGIPDLLLPHEVVPPVAEWTELRKAPEDETLELAYFTFPQNAVIVVDEAQRIYRPRALSSKVPPEVAAFETHRHTGVDFILITQHPGLLDPNIKKLVGKHIHIAVTPFGRYRYEWTKCVDPESKTERDIAARSKYTLPKRAFSLYKSSELHTKIKVRMPGYVYLLGIALIACLGVAWYVYGRIQKVTGPQEIAQMQNRGQSTGGSSGQPHQTTTEYLSSLAPRVPGLFHTAPRYDQVTMPNDAPWPSLCVISHATDKCRCLDQQGNDYQTTDGTCRNIVAHGLFRDFAKPQQDDSASSRNERASAREARADAPSAPAVRQSAPSVPSSSPVSMPGPASPSA